VAHTKAGGSTKTNRDSISKRLGVKRYGGEKVINGNILVRQKGNKFYPGLGTKQGNDFTIYSITSGIVKFSLKRGRKTIEVSEA
jgi:large subunit ribosomal protein L27